VRWREEECCKQATDRKAVKARFDRIFALLAEFGPALSEPHVKHLGDGLWEARHHAYRMFYCCCGPVYLVVGGVVKKKRRLHPDELATARRWCAEALAEREGGGPNGPA